MAERKMKFRQLIPEYPLGSDITVMNTQFHYGIVDKYGNKSKDTMTIIYKDNATGEKHFTVIDDPDYVFYMLKPEYPTPSYSMYFAKEDNLEYIKCKYRNINKSIASNLDIVNNNTDATDLYKFNIKNRDFKKNKDFQKNNRVFGSDISINDFYRMRFAEQYKNTENPVSIAFMDIETDVKLAPTIFPVDGNCPINAVSYMDRENKVLDTFLLNQEDVNPQVRPFIDSYNEKSFNKEFKDFLVDSLGGQNKVEHFKLQDLRVRVHIFDDELKMLTVLFKYINYMKPDFLLCWNMSFDIPFIINRIKVLGGEPADIICPPEFPDRVKFCDYILDKKNEEFKKKNDYADITSYTVYLDQLIQFASRRSNSAKYRSYSLENIGEEVAGVTKLDYSNITNNVVNLPYADYRTFVKYNMMDVLVQYCIEFCTDDIAYVFDKVLLNSTEYKKIHRQTVYLANRATVMFRDFGDYILGNNVNKYKPKPETKYEGAFVADPTKFSDTNKEKINGKPIMRTSNAIDFDFSSLYPSITKEYNMAPNTQIGYIQIPNKVYANENAINNEKYTRSGQYIEDMTSDNEIEFAHRWYHLANFKEMYMDCLEYFNTMEESFKPLRNDDLVPKPIYTPNPNMKKKIFTTIDRSKTDFAKYTEPLNNETKEKINKLFDDM